MVKDLNVLKMVGLLVLSVYLTACAEMNADFTCPMSDGMQCKRIDQVNNLVNQGSIDTNSHDAPTSPRSHHQVSPDGNLANAAFIYPYPSSTDVTSGQPLRFGESVMRLWIAPYEDGDENYHTPSIIYTLVAPGHWIDQPLPEITESV